MSTPSDSIHNIDTNIDRINQNINNIHSMMNIMSNSIILNQLNDIRRPRANPTLFTTPSLLTPNIFSNPRNLSNSTNSTSNPTNSTSNPPSNTSSNPFTNLFSSLLRNEGFPMPVGMGIGNMEISVLRPSVTEPEPNIVISHHNIFNNTKIKLKTCDDNELEQCTICLADIENNQIIREINKCKHNFHVECSDKWFEEHITCPHCRQDIRIEMVD